MLALEHIPGLFEEAESVGSWMSGTHFRNSAETKSTKKSFVEPLLSVDRNMLMLTLLTNLMSTKPDRSSSIDVHFDTKLTDIDMSCNEATNIKMMSLRRISYYLIIW